MSNYTNDLLIEWAHELMEDEFILGTHAEKAIQRDLDSGDLQALAFTVSFYAAEASREHFHAFDI